MVWHGEAELPKGLDLIVASTDKTIVMIEGFAHEIPEPEMHDARWWPWHSTSSGGQQFPGQSGPGCAHSLNAVTGMLSTRSQMMRSAMASVMRPSAT